MRKTGILSKMLAWKDLTSELSTHFGTDPERLPSIVQTVLEAASEKHEENLQSLPDPAPTAKQAQPRRIRRTVATDRVTFKDKLAEVMAGHGILHYYEITEKMRAAGHISERSKKPANHVQVTMCQNPQMFNRCVNIGAGYYSLNEAYEKTLLATKKPAAPEEAPPVAQDLPPIVEVLKVAKGLAQGPKTMEKSFNIGSFSKAVGVSSKTACTVLNVLREQKVVAKCSTGVWRLRDRRAVADKLEEWRKLVKDHKEKAA